MKVFSIGDEVKRISGSFKNMRVGHHDTIVNIIENDGGLKTYSLANYGGGHSPKSFELMDSLITNKSYKDE